MSAVCDEVWGHNSHSSWNNKSFVDCGNNDIIKKQEVHMNTHGLMLHVQAARFKQTISNPRAHSLAPCAGMTENCHLCVQALPFNTKATMTQNSDSRKHMEWPNIPLYSHKHGKNQHLVYLKITKIQTKSPNKQGTMCRQSVLSVCLNARIKEGCNYSFSLCLCEIQWNHRAWFYLT